MGLVTPQLILENILFTLKFSFVFTRKILQCWQSTLQNRGNLEVSMTKEKFECKKISLKTFIFLCFSANKKFQHKKKKS